MKIALAALVLGLGLMLGAGCMTNTGNCIYAAHGGNVDNHKAGDDHPINSDSGCKVITTINYIVIGRTTGFATIKDATDQEVGSAMLAEGSDGVVVAAETHGLAPGKYAMHVSAVGRCDPLDFLSAGPYLNETVNKQGRQFGLGNFVVSANGGGSTSATIKGATLDDRRNGLLSPNGTAIVIEEKIGKDAKAAHRIACGVIKHSA